MAESRWNPWRELRARGHIVLERQPLPAGLRGLYGRRGGRAAIVLNTELDAVERNAVLAHELVHDERGGGIDAAYMPKGWDAVVAREEDLVEREVARRLVPSDELVAFIERRRTIGEPVTARAVVEEFDVPTWVAERALRLAQEESIRRAV